MGVEMSLAYKHVSFEMIYVSIFTQSDNPIGIKREKKSIKQYKQTGQQEKEMRG